MREGRGLRWPFADSLRRRALLLSLLLHLLVFFLLLVLPPPKLPPPVNYVVALRPEEAPLPLPREVRRASPQAAPAASEKRASPVRPLRGGREREGPAPSPNGEASPPRPGAAREGAASPSPGREAARVLREGAPASPVGVQEEAGDLREKTPTSTGGAGEGAEPLPSPRPSEQEPGGGERLAPLGVGAPSPEGLGPAPKGVPQGGEGVAPSPPPASALEGRGGSGAASAEASAPKGTALGGSGTSEALSPSGKEGATPEGLGPGQGWGRGEEGGRCALVVELGGLPYAPGPSPALLDPEGRQVWPDPVRVRGVPTEVVDRSGIALFFRPGEFKEEGYTRVYRVRALATRPRTAESRFPELVLLSREDALRVREVPPVCQLVFLR